MDYEKLSDKELKVKLRFFKAVFKYEKDSFSLEQIECIEKLLNERKKILKRGGKQ